jgi:hypothetical protein
LDSDWTAGCHIRRRISCPSCFRSHTSCNASPYSENQATRSPCSTPPYGSAAGCVKDEPASGFDSVYGRRVMWPPLRQLPDRCLATPFGLPGHRLARVRPASPHSVASWPWRGRLDDPPSSLGRQGSAGGRGVKVWLDRRGNRRLPAREIFVKKSGSPHQRVAVAFTPSPAA